MNISTELLVYSSFVNIETKVLISLNSHYFLSANKIGRFEKKVSKEKMKRENAKNEKFQLLVSYYCKSVLVRKPYLQKRTTVL